MATRNPRKAKAATPRSQGSRANGQWLARLGMYHRKRALTFQSQGDLHKAIDALWDPQDELYRMPWACGDASTMIVPEDAVPVFRARQLRFVDYPVVPAVRRPARPGDSNVA